MNLFLFDEYIFFVYGQSTMNTDIFLGRYNQNPKLNYEVTREKSVIMLHLKCHIIIYSGSYVNTPPPIQATFVVGN